MKTRNVGRNRIGMMDIVILILLLLFTLAVLIPFLNVVAVSLTSYQEYMQVGWVVWPKSPTLDSYRELLNDGRILKGFKTTCFYLLVGVPLNLFLCCTLAYALSRQNWPGRKLVFYLVLITMIFNGGIVPLYLTLKDMGLMGSVWGVVLPQGMNTFNMILIYNYFLSLPESLVESAELDGASEWKVLWDIMLPLSKPILATVCLFTAVSLWNEYFYSMTFLRSNDWMSLQQVLRSIVMDSQMVASQGSVSSLSSSQENFTQGIKMAAVIVTMIPIMCVYPFLQKYFTKGILIGAVKT